MFGNRHRVILYGVSLLLEGVRASLKSCPDIDLWVLDPAQGNTIEAVREICPAVFVFDLGTIQVDFQLSLLRLPGLLLVGIDPETHQALVWSGQRESAADSFDLVDIVCKRTPDSR